MNTIFDKISEYPPGYRYHLDESTISKWLFQLEVFEAFQIQEINEVANLLEGVKLKKNQRIQFEEGIEFCFVWKGYIEYEMNGGERRKKNKVEKVEKKKWVTGKHYSGKKCNIIGLDEQNEVIFLTSLRAKKILSKKQRNHWAQLATIIQRQPLFKYLDKDTLLDIAVDAKVKIHPYNSCIYKKGDIIDFSFILMQGNITILNEGTQVSILNPQQVFGDQQILSGHSVRKFKALVSSEKVKVLRIQKQKINKALTVLTVLGREKLIQNYIQSKNKYRNFISKSINRYRNSLGRSSSQKAIDNQALPYFKISKKPSIKRNFNPQQFYQPPKQIMSPLRLVTSRRSSMSIITQSKQSPTLISDFKKYQSIDFQKRSPLSRLPLIKY